MFFRALISIISFTNLSIPARAVPATTWTSLQQILHCNGPYSDLQYRDCEGQYFNTTGCYFLPHFAQYRACAAICNDVTVHTIAEMKCRSYCPDYLESCSLILQSTSAMSHINTATQSAADTMTTYLGGVELLSRPALIALSCSITVLIVAALAAIGWCMRGENSCKGRKPLSHRELLPNAHPAVQESDDTVREEHDDVSEYTAIVTYTSDNKSLK